MYNNLVILHWKYTQLSYRQIDFAKLLEQDILEAFVSHELLARVQNGDDVVGIFVRQAIVCFRLQKSLDFL